MSAFSEDVCRLYVDLKNSMSLINMIWVCNSFSKKRKTYRTKTTRSKAKLFQKTAQRACTFWIMLLCNSYKELPDTNSNFLIKMTLEMA